MHDKEIISPYIKYGTYDEWKDESGLGSQFNINDHAFKTLTDKTSLSYPLELNDLMEYFLRVNKGITGGSLDDLLAQWDLSWV